MEGDLFMIHIFSNVIKYNKIRSKKILKNSIVVWMGVLLFITPVLMDATDLGDLPEKPILKLRYRSDYVCSGLSTDSLKKFDSPIIAADKDLNKELNVLPWLGEGCLTGVATIFALMHINNTIAWSSVLYGMGFISADIAYAFKPTPKKRSFIGKSPEYISAYMKEYGTEGRKRQASAAFSGYTLAIGIPFALVVLYIGYCFMFDPSCGAY